MVVNFIFGLVLGFAGGAFAAYKYVSAKAAKAAAAAIAAASNNFR